MCAARVAAHVNEAGLNDGTAGIGDEVIATVDNVRLKNVIIAEDIFHAADMDKGAERPAAAITVGQVITPPARSPKLDGRSLQGCVACARAAAGMWTSSVRDDFLRHFGAHWNVHELEQQ